MQKKSYFNSVSIEQPQLALYEDKAKAQEVNVSAIYRNDNKPYTASQVYTILISDGVINHKVPLTSIRRAISVLKRKGELIKLPDTRIGIMGHPEHYYSLKLMRA